MALGRHTSIRRFDWLGVRVCPTTASESVTSNRLTARPPPAGTHKRRDTLKLFRITNVQNVTNDEIEVKMTMTLLNLTSDDGLDHFSEFRYSNRDSSRLSSIKHVVMFNGYGLMACLEECAYLSSWYRPAGFGPNGGSSLSAAQKGSKARRDCECPCDFGRCSSCCEI
jgi:hypothetical protein